MYGFDSKYSINSSGFDARNLLPIEKNTIPNEILSTTRSKILKQGADSTLTLSMFNNNELNVMVNKVKPFIVIQGADALFRFKPGSLTDLSLPPVQTIQSSGRIIVSNSDSRNRLALNYPDPLMARSSKDIKQPNTSTESATDTEQRNINSDVTGNVNPYETSQITPTSVISDQPNTNQQESLDTSNETKITKDDDGVSDGIPQRPTFYEMLRDLGVLQGLVPALLVALLGALGWWLKRRF